MYLPQGVDQSSNPRDRAWNPLDKLRLTELVHRAEVIDVWAHDAWTVVDLEKLVTVELL